MSSEYSDIEFRSPAEIQQLQEQLLSKQLQYLQANSAFYRRMFAEHRIDVSKIRTLDDLRNVPFTEKADLQLHNADFL